MTYDTSGNTQTDGTNTYTWDGESQLKTAAGVTYKYDGDGRRAAKAGSKLYWYGSGGEILSETDASGNTQNEYIFFGGRRVAVVPVSGSALYYAEDFLGSSRVMVQSTGTLCYDADFTPFGGERAYKNTCAQNYKFEGRERDTETQNDDFGARYYSWRFGRWLSSDWSAVPVAVPYANLTNPQTLNLYSMVVDDPESFADLDGHETGDWAAPGNGLDSLGQVLPDTSQFRPKQDPPSCWCGDPAQNQAQGAGQAHGAEQNGDVATANHYLSRSKEMRLVQKAFKSGHFHLEIIHDGRDRYDPATRTVYWDPHSALRTTEGGHQTPALGLGHEEAHATGNRHDNAVLSGTPDAQYQWREERRVILNYENPAARELGESTRSNHGGTPYNVDCPTCQ